MSKLTRRQALASAAALPLASTGVTMASAATDIKEPSLNTFKRFRHGDFSMTVLLAGTATREEPHSIFGLNASPDEFSQVSTENFIPDDKAQFFFTPTLVNTGSELILFDTGLNADGITGVLGDAGYTPDQIDTVVITHMHGDHIGGLMTDAGDPTFPNARFVTGSVEHNYWAEQDNDGFKAKVAPLNDKMTFLEGGGEVASGMTAIEAFGHTPGHMAYHVESAGQELTLIADTANHYVWSLGYPDWEVSFDVDKEMAAATRRGLLEQLSSERTPFIGYHMPFPALGYAAKRDDGFRFVPSSYQTML
ncbi:MBL fold metallo-hydrolase [Qingshengfaniella alkalisoli]|uniref:MBL fold metallo-hydrolase n=1 Tax=Qingshengfaniella alkalisoli TaxID=2599296 RepID=A0A5B8J4Y5_9RHOB|nr:MBL fold metallo-hydrolase [Qingshengfaniella alkalisoli]QDY69607.1 MBL fold metallo-hydrolase [Qingshengfaniella alkalisoli]